AGWTIETANDDEPGRSSNLGDVAGQDRHGEDQDRRSEDRARRYEHRDTRRRALGTTAHRQTDPHGDDQDDQEEDNRDHRQLPCHDPNVTPLRSVSQPRLADKTSRRRLTRPGTAPWSMTRPMYPYAHV